MHIVRFQGGLANQLFQLCFYVKLKELYGNDRVCADISHYRTNHDHGGYKLDRFFDLQYINKLPNNYVEVNECNYNDISIDEKEVYLYNGYWQSEIYFPNDLSILKSIFNEKRLNDDNKNILSIIRSSVSVSVHVRRGDYVDNYFHGNISNKVYIENAIKYINEHIDNPSFFIFSDDIPWCKENLKDFNSNVYYVSGNEKQVELDIFMMSQCKHNIIANSSFSWWAQKLNNSVNKIVISPEYWFNYASPLDTLNCDGFVHVKNTPFICRMIDKPRFSILIPVYNREDSIRCCLASALNQSYENIEVIVVDDASTDRSYEILMEYQKIDTRLKVIRKEKNESLLSARLAAMRESRGDFVIFLDSDDYISLDACKILEDVLRVEIVDIVEFSYMKEPEKITVTNENEFNSHVVSDLLEGSYPHTVWNKCYSQRLVKDLLVNAEDFYCNMTEDVYFTTIFLTLSRSYKIINDVLYHYVTNSGMTRARKMSISSMNNAIESLDNKKRHLVEYLQKKNSDLVGLVDIISAKDVDYMAYLCTTLQQPINEKMELMQMLDDRFKTDYSDKYNADMEKAYKTYLEFRNSGIKRSIKLAVSYGVNFLKKRLVRSR